MQALSNKLLQLQQQQSAGCWLHLLFFKLKMFGFKKSWLNSKIFKHPKVEKKQGSLKS